MSNGGVSASPSSLSAAVLGLRPQRSRTWEPEHRYDTLQRRKCRRRSSSVVVCLLGDKQKGKKGRRRSHSFCERETYKQVLWKSLDINIRLPDGSSRRVVGDERMQVWDLAGPLAAELRLHEPKLYMARSGAPLDEGAPASLLPQGEELLLDEGKPPWDPRSAEDERLRTVEELLSSEKEYANTLKTVCDLYEKPLRKLLCMEKEDYKSFFDWVEPICSLSKMVIIKLAVAIEEWESRDTKVGNIFSKLLWNKYEEYLILFGTTTLPLLKEKQTSDEDFVALCRLRQGAAKYSLEDLLHLPLERLVQYEQYLSRLADNTSPDHPDYNDICRTAAKATNMVRRADANKEESDLDRIQDLFPGDSLRLHERDPLSPRKGLLRSKSSAASKIQKNLTTKVKSSSNESPHHRTDVLSPQKRHLWGDDNFRVFIMESSTQFTMVTEDNTLSKCFDTTMSSVIDLTIPDDYDDDAMPLEVTDEYHDLGNFLMFGANMINERIIVHICQYVEGVQKQDRHLFLFNDLLLIAKPRSGGTYKLKDKVRLCEIWLSQCLADVCESLKSPATSFVIGWPTTNVVVTFSSVTTKELWQQKLLQLLEECKEKEGKTLTSIQVSYRSPDTCEEICTTLKVDNRHSVQDSIKLILQQLRQPESSIKDFKLWVKTGKDDAPYPLIGHEYPFSIKMNFIRELLRRSDLDLRNFNNISTDSKCYFILRKDNLNSSIRADPRATKKRKKHRRPQNKIHWLFRRQGVKLDSVDSGNGSPTPNGIFGQPLWKICPDNTIPKPIMSMLVQLFHQAPFTVGIFRKSANARACRELKEKLKMDPDFDMHNISVIVLSSVFKEFLRNLPDCLLQSEMYKHWLQAVSFESDWECRKRILSLLSQLPPPNMLLLQYTLCMLWHIAQHSSENKMSSTNLAVCIGPSLLNPGCYPSSSLQQEDVTKKVPKAVSYLIDHCPELFGENILRLLGPFPQRSGSRQDSGAEESDSLHSLQDLNGPYRRDDSSIDSLDRDFLDEIEASPKLPCKSKMSLTNLSRDSGLTLSDTQLYTPEEEAESESSSADSRRGHHSVSLTKSVPHLDSAGIECHTASYSKNAGVSIDGSCHDVVRKRRQGMLENHRMKTLAACTSLPFSQPNGHYDANPHLPLQFSQSYSYTMQQDLMGHMQNQSPRNAEFTVKRRINRGRSYIDRPIVSSVDPVEEYTNGTLRRSASEESLLQNYVTTSASKRTIAQRKRRAPSPPARHGSLSAPSSERKQCDTGIHGIGPCSANDTPDRHAVWFAIHSRRADWKRSQSTSKIDELDQAHDSSTLSLVSSEDSTPHISRSNSTRVQELSSQSHGDLCGLYCTPPRVNSISSSTSDGSQQSHHSHCSLASNKSSGSHRSNRSNCSVGSSSLAKHCEPPSYLETINRQSILKQLQQPVVTEVTEEMRAEQTTLSAKARELYENSVRLYVQQIPDLQDQTHRAVPVTVESPADIRKHPIKSTQTPPRITSAENFHHPRLRHLPPVHVTDAQLTHRLRNFQIKPRHPKDGIPDDLRKEINWSVAQLREFFNQQQKSDPRCCSKRCAGKSEEQLSHAECNTTHRVLHTRSRSLSSRSEEESFV